MGHDELGDEAVASPHAGDRYIATPRVAEPVAHVLPTVYSMGHDEIRQRGRGEAPPRGSRSPSPPC